MAPTKLIRTDDWLLSGGNDLMERTQATTAVYRDYVWRLCGIILTHWPKLGKLGADEQPLAVERLFNRTKANPEPRYARFFETTPAFRRFPSYLRRAAIRAAVGQVSSFLTRYDQWQTHQRKHASDRPPSFGRPNVWPVLYTAKGGAGAMARFNGDAARLKLWDGRKWAWFPAAVVRRGSRHEGTLAGDPQSPTLRIKQGRVVLTQPFEMPRYSSLGDREVVCSADLGINKTATAAIVASDGTVRRRLSIHRTQHDDQRDKAAVAIRGKARKTMGGMRGKNHKSPLEARIAAEVEAIQAGAWEEILRLAPDLETSADRLEAILGRAQRKSKSAAKRLRTEANAAGNREKGEKAEISQGAGKLSKGFCAGLYARVRGLNLAIARDTARALIAFAQANGATVIVFERLKGWRPKAGGKGGTMKARFHHWLHRALVKQVAASFAEQGGRVAFVSPWGTSAWAFDGSGKVTRPTGAHDVAVFTTGKRYDADLNAAYNIGAKVRHESRLKGVVLNEPSIVSMLSPEMACEISNDFVRSPTQKPKETPNCLERPGEVKVGRVNASESLTKRRYYGSPKSAVDAVILGQSKLGFFAPRCRHRDPGVKETPTPTASPSCGTWKPRWGLVSHHQ